VASQDYGFFNLSYTLRPRGDCHISSLFITTQVASSRATPAMPRVTVQHHISKQFEIIIKQGWGRKMVSLAIQTA
jgi:hypothetical protein